MMPTGDNAGLPVVGKRRRLLFVTGNTSGIEPYFYLSAVRPWVEGLGHHFEVTCLEEPDGLDAAVERVRPDLLLFFGAKTRLLYSGPVFDCRARFGIPVAALTLMDAHSPAKQAFFEHAWRLGVEACFCIDTGMREMCGGFADAVYYCPWFVNHEITRDFGEPKRIPVALIGDGFLSTGTDWRYPWRRAVAGKLREEFPTFSSPRPTSRFPHELVGEAYGRMLNRSLLAFSCGGSRHIFMKKNLEIPASRCCMVSEVNAGLLHLGFRDMENCVFVTPSDAVEKCRYLLEHPDELQALTDRGFRFVREHHDARNRTMIAEWLMLRLDLPAGRRIVQPDVCGPLRAVPVDSGERGVLLTGESPFVSGMEQASSRWSTGDVSGCLAAIEDAARMLPLTMEPKFLKALVALAEGDPRGAVDGFQEILRLGIFWGAERPDPLLWGFYLLALDRSGQTETAARLAAAFPDVDHPVLRDVRASLGAAGVGGGLCCRSVFASPWFFPESPEAFLAALRATVEQNCSGGGPA